MRPSTRSARIWAARDTSIDAVIKSPEEMVIMASLVEKETGVETERPQVASVFINRLKKSMRLQTDPTVIYGITQGQGPLGRGLTRSELNAKTPYNTYQIDGLPPTPIANPGAAALEAVAHPARPTTSTSSPRAPTRRTGICLPRLTPSIARTSLNTARPRTKPPARNSRRRKHHKPETRPNNWCSALRMANALSSMTGYARAQGGVPGISFSIEIKTVNARGLDVRMRMTPGYDALEAEIRRRISKAVSRGSVTVNLNVDRDGEGGRVVVNHEALNAVLAALTEIAGKVDARKPTLDGILGLKGVLEQHDAPLAADTEEKLHAAIYAALDKALGDLAHARRAEGARTSAS